MPKRRRYPRPEAETVLAAFRASGLDIAAGDDAYLALRQLDYSDALAKALIADEVRAARQPRERRRAAPL